MAKPLILITNDDGIEAEGIHKLAEFVSHMGEVVVVAPDSARSGGSMALTVEIPLRIKECGTYLGMRMLSTNGTPVDCVKIACNVILDRQPDIVLSGINHGSNTGNSVNYSGTMGAAIEGCLRGIPSIGYSCVSHKATTADFDACRQYIERITAKVLAEGLPDDVCLNVNMPVGKPITGIAITQSCRGRWQNEYAELTNPRGQKIYYLTGDYLNLDPDNPDTDLAQIEAGKIAVTPITPQRDATLDNLTF